MSGLRTEEKYSDYDLTNILDFNLLRLQEKVTKERWDEALWYLGVTKRLIKEKRRRGQ